MTYKHITLSIITTLLLASCSSKDARYGESVPVNFSQVEINDSFWAPRLARHATSTLPAVMHQCKTETHRIDNFAIAAGLQEGKFRGYFYDDSDLYKMLEGAAYSLTNNPNPSLEAEIDEIIDKIAGAQMEDGYINTYYELNFPDKRWTDMDKHEMYCGGHLIEAAIAYYNATGKRKLLDVAIRFADHLDSRFGEGKEDWVPGHPEIELALIKLYRTTGDKRYLSLSHFLLEQRGRGLGTWNGSTSVLDNSYYVDYQPVAELSRIGGHAVRAMYLFTGMADYTAATGDTSYMPALDRLWDNVVLANMYATGGIGSSGKNEGFTEDYDLPNREAYCETCASVGMVLWNQRMNMINGESRYVDIMERAMYNGALAGMNLAGDRFFYVNPLGSDGNHHRRAWYGTACCPSQISRFLPSIGNYIYTSSKSAINVNLYVGSKANIALKRGNVELTQSTAYPWEGLVAIDVNVGDSLPFEMRLRIPEWCEKFSIRVNDKKVDYEMTKGYAVLNRMWSKGDKVTLDMKMDIRVVEADPRVKADKGLRSIQRGPLVYCIEEVDNPDYEAAELSADTKYSYKFENGILGGVNVITAKTGSQKLTFVPYYAWDNRAAGKMDVWVKYKTDLQARVYEELPLGAIKPEGWLLEMLKRQRDGLSSHIDELYSEVMGPRNGWLGGDGDQWERGPYWIDGALPLAYLLDDEILKAKAQPWIEWALASQTEDGFFGPSVDYPAEKGLQRNNSKDWWPRMVMLKIMKQYYNATGDQRVVDFLTKYFHYQLRTLPSVPLGNWTFWAEYRACDNMEVALWLYGITGDSKLLELTDLLHSQSFDYTDNFLNGDLLRRQSSIHCVNLGQGIKEPVVYWQRSQEDKYLEATKKAFADLREFNGFPSGVFGGDELLHGNNPTQGSELCTAVELMYSLELMTQITGDLSFVDHLERVAYNALPTQISDDFMARQYFQQSNQVEISRNLRNFDINHGQTDLVFGMLSGYPCCTSNLHQGWPKFTQNLWYKTADGGVAALAYAPSKMSLNIGGSKVSIVEKTCYPFSEEIEFEIGLNQASQSFPLHLRIPSWTKDAKLTVNGKTVQAGAAGSVAVIKREWRNGDVVKLTLPMPLRSSEWYERSVAVERGPLVYALRIEEDWQKKDLEEGSIYGKYYWEVYPKSKWNYGLMTFDADNMEKSFEVVVDKKKLASNWYWNLESTPISIKAKAKEIKSWTMYNHSAGPQPYGYSIYSLRDDIKDVPVETVTLVPYGATTLRITQFPVIYQ